MAYDEHLADRIRTILRSKKVSFIDREMFGGIAFMVDGKMCVGIIKNDLMARVDPDSAALLLKKKGARPMDFAKRPMKGYLYIAPTAVDSSADLKFWIEQCLTYNPKAKASKKKI